MNPDNSSIPGPKKRSAIICPHCKTSNRPNRKFCISCGFGLSPCGAAPDESSPSAEVRWEEAVAFADDLPSWDILPPDAPVRRYK